MSQKIFVLVMNLCFFCSAYSDEYGATALDVVKKMNLKKINEEAEAKDLEERKQHENVPSLYKVSPENPFYKNENNVNGQAPFLRSTDPR